MAPGIEVGRSGSLTAIGTAEKPIVFTAANKVGGAWTGLIFFQSASPANQLEQVKIEYACDGGRIGGHRAAVELIGANTASNVSMKDSVISDCTGYPVCLQNFPLEQSFTYSNVRSVRNEYDTVVSCN